MTRRQELEELSAFLAERDDDDSYFGEVFLRFRSELNKERARGAGRDENAYLNNLEQTREEDLADYQRDGELVQYLRFAESFMDDIAEAIEDLEQSGN